MNKKATLGEGVMMIYRILIIALVAFIILGISSIFYAHHVDIKDAEARIMAKQIINCIAPKGYTQEWIFQEQKENTLYEQCNIKGGNLERFFIKITIKEETQETTITQGDSGSTWIKKILETATFVENSQAEKYKPGYYQNTYPVRIRKESTYKGDGEIIIEVLVQEDEG